MLFMLPEGLHVLSRLQEAGGQQDSLFLVPNFAYRLIRPLNKPRRMPYMWKYWYAVCNHKGVVVLSASSVLGPTQAQHLSHCASHMLKKYV